MAISTLYFDAKPPPSISMATTDYVAGTGYATAIPMHVRFTAKKYPIVGTTLDYFVFRESRLREGKALTRLGDCVLGSSVADALGVKPGERLLSDPENVFDLAGSYPLNMRVVGILARTGTPDDNAVFIDIQSAWVIEGIGHGHQGLEREDDSNLILKSTENNVTASPAVVQYTEITDENLASFHFHGAPADFPVSSVIAVPPDEASATKLMGRFVSDSSKVRVVEPPEVIEQLLAIVFRVKKFFDAAAWLIGIVSLLFLVLVTILTLRLRQREMQTMFKLGCSRGTIAQLQLAELAIVVGTSVVLAVSIAILVQQFGTGILRQLFV
ncbi:MAG: ABC transporter permease [Planctomycetaceae bacterium]